MSTPINLNHVRKAKQKAVREKQAAENRIAFGRTKAEKDLAKAQKQKISTTVDAHKLDGAPDQMPDA